MCGINGFTFSDSELIGKMNRLTEHRGPDATDFWVGDGVSLGHDRLAIIDLSHRGSQPMWDSKREVVIVYNGEIYNYLELRDELKKDYQFQSDSDTEVILAAYKKYGADCVKKFNGMFAFAIWDTRTRELFLARDHIGIIPLYYYHEGNKFIFSSEIKAILADEEVPRKVDKRAFNLYFQLLYVPQPYTMFENIKKLPPAYTARFKNGVFTLARYWQVGDCLDLNTSYNEVVNNIRGLFEDSVSRQLISDRPLGVFLSGGLDSTAVLGRVAEVHRGKIKTFSVGFKDSVQTEKFNKDFELARSTAKHYDTNHNELLIGPKDLYDNLERIVWHMDEPNSNATAGAIFLLSEMAKKEVAVVLGGDGGDELFGGYPRYYFSRFVSAYQCMPLALQKFGLGILRFLGKMEDAHKLALRGGPERISSFLSQKNERLAKVVQRDIFDENAAINYLRDKFFKNNDYSSISTETDFEKRFMSIDLQSWLVDESLLRTNKMCMAFGLESRVPLLDHRLVDIATRISTKWKFSLLQKPSKFQGKAIWRDAVQKYIPPHILRERKRGWFTPMSKWLRTPLFYDLARDIFRKDRLHEWFDAREVKRLWQDHVDGRAYNLNIIWATIMWQLWYEEFIKKKT